MNILSALFLDTIDARTLAGPTTRLDLTGVQFSAPAPQEFPFVWAPHLVLIVHCPEDHSPNAALEVVFRRGDEQVARNVQPLQVEPGRFSYRLVRAEVTFEEPGSIAAHCRIDQGPVMVVPYTVMPPVDPATAVDATTESPVESGGATE
jgi:hypothetical protein